MSTLILVRALLVVCVFCGIGWLVRAKIREAHGQKNRRQESLARCEAFLERLRRGERPFLSGLDVTGLSVQEIETFLTQVRHIVRDTPLDN